TREALGHAFDDRVVVTPDASVAEMARSAGVKVHEIEHPRSDVIAQIGWKKIRAAETISPEELEANYIRRSDVVGGELHPAVGCRDFRQARALTGTPCRRTGMLRLRGFVRKRRDPLRSGMTSLVSIFTVNEDTLRDARRYPGHDGIGAP